jgi:cytochrome oxidase Cu insertion factor (SCO1/SenC/PrrC family)
MRRHHQKLSRVVILVFVAIAGVLVAPAMAQYDYDYPVPKPGTYELPPIKKAADGKVLQSGGREARLYDVMDGYVTVLSFIYTRCRDPYACPLASGVLYEIHNATKTDSLVAGKLQLITFSFDPEHDTPTVMADYGKSLRSEGEGCRWQFLTTAGVEDLQPILDAYGQRVDRKKDPTDPLGPLSHLVRVYLIDRDKSIRNIYAFGLMDPRLLMADVRTLLMEEASHAAAE